MITGTTRDGPYVMHGGTDGPGGSRAGPTGGGPIVNVREDRERATTRVVLGVDGSAGVGATLAWALYAAAAQRSVVLVVTAFPADIAWYDDCEADSRVEAIRWEAARRTQELVAEALAPPAEGVGRGGARRSGRRRRAGALDQVRGRPRRTRRAAAGPLARRGARRR